MIALLAGIAFAIYGSLQARRRKGSTPDILQYAAVYGIIGLLLGFLVSILIARLA